MAAVLTSCSIMMIYTIGEYAWLLRSEPAARPRRLCCRVALLLPALLLHLLRCPAYPSSFLPVFLGDFVATPSTIYPTSQLPDHLQPSVSLPNHR
jgi:hypothetical protein